MIQEIKDGYNVIMLTKFGSHLYGTDTPESDTDYKGIFLPTKEQILLGNIPKSVSFDSNPGHDKNIAEDVDCELYSFHYFMHLCCKGEMVAMDMLHTNEENIIVTSDLWKKIQDIRDSFYSTDMKAFVGYARKQASKYNLRGSRLNVLKSVIDVLEDM